MFKTCYAGLHPGDGEEMMEPKTTKSALTRARIQDAALTLFSREGFHRTTMRAIAAEAGVSPGNAYYHFASKEDLVQELARGLIDEQLRAARPLLLSGNNLQDNIRIVLDAAVDVVTPFHDFGSVLIRAAMNPDTAATADVTRAKEFSLWRQAVAASLPRPPLAIRGDLPELLWLVQRGLIIFWAYDSSPDTARSRRLAANAAALMARLAVLSRLPVVRHIVDDVIGVVRNVQRDETT
ncbi:MULTISPECIES: TetR/AcrR family transcriptional regulator [Micrococcaceae]|nr:MULTISPECIES: TetR/AcrR family transcriptional regulator [Micrococcaceae]PCC24038.1 TetR/AcrR family transcriptional regulator [Glutamicibacter sp. BW78]